MDRRKERRAGMSRIGTVHDEDRSFDREFWVRVPPAERLALVWDMALEALEWRGEGGGQSRLQRSVCRLERGRAHHRRPRAFRNTRASGRPQDLLDLQILESG
jgi:hypothetical protein